MTETSNEIRRKLFTVFKLSNLYISQCTVLLLCRWREKQERGFTCWLNHLLTPSLLEVDGNTDTSVAGKHCYSI